MSQTNQPENNEVGLREYGLNELAAVGRVNRRELLRMGGIGGAGLLLTGVLAGCGGSSTGNPSIGSSIASAMTSTGNMDQAILNAAATAEALATVMYYYIIITNQGIYRKGLTGNAPDKAYLVAGYEQELNHYNFLVGAGAKPLALRFYFPTGMFMDPQVTMNTLITLEDAFIAAYLIGVRDFSTTALKVIAAQIMGVEAEHRVLGRTISADLGLTSVTGLAGAESVVPPNNTTNNIAYERTFSSALPDINHVVAALGPFVTPGAKGYMSTVYEFYTANNAAPSAGQPTVTLAGKTPNG
jgi:hypothetical protein